MIANRRRDGVAGERDQGRAGDGGAAVPVRPSMAELEAFVRVAEFASFSRAAVVLGVTQPTVSLRVQALEEVLGLRLLHRRQKPLLTEAGRDLFNRARLVIGRLDELASAAADLRTLRRGRLRVGFSTPAFAMPLLQRLVAAHPGIGLATVYDNTAGLMDRLQRCTIDVAVTTLARVPPMVSAALIDRQQLRFCLHASDPWLGDTAADTLLSMPLAAIAERRLIRREPGSTTRLLFERACAEHGIAPADTLDVPTREAVKEAVACGLGVGVVLSGEIGMDPRLRAAAIAGIDAVANVYALVLPEGRALPAVEALLALLPAIASSP